MLKSLNFRIIAGFLTSFLALVFVAAFTVKDAMKVIDNNNEVDRVQQIITDLQRLNVNILNIENGQRSYVISGERNYLRPYFKARNDLPAIIKGLEINLRDPVTVKDFEAIKDLITERIKYAEQIIEIRERLGYLAAIKAIKLKRGSEIMDKIQRIVEDLNEKEKKIFAAKLFNSDESIRDTIITAGVGLIITTFLLIFGSYYLIRSISIPISELVTGVEKFGEGDFYFRSDVKSNDEMGRLSNAFNEMGEKLAFLMEEEKKHSKLLENMSFAAIYIGSEALSDFNDSDKVLQIITDKARMLTGADYGALGIGTDPNEQFNPWVFSGMEEDIVKRIGRFPRSVGLLGWVARQGQVVRLSDLRDNPIFEGFPEGHPAMGPLLGVPIRFKGQSVGNLYLAKKPGRELFSEYDQRAVELLTANAGVVLENARLHTELQKAISSREDVLAIVSHDLKNPLGTIRLSSELLAKKAPAGESGNAIRKYSGNIQASSNQMLRMIGDLLDAASIEAGKIQVNPKVQEAASCMQEVERQFGNLAEEKNINLSFDSIPENVHLFCDPDRIHQVFSNLIGNALKFTPPEGTIKVSSQLLRGFIEFTVSDTGAGISKEDQEHLFDRYWQVKGTKQKGSGLGLFIAKGIVEAHQGVLKVDSQPGKGTSFSFTIPLA